MANIFDNISNILTVVMGLFTGLKASGVLPSGQATQIASLLADIEKIAADAAHPSASQITDIVALLNDLKAGNYISGAVVDEAISSLTKFGASASNYLSGQAAIIDSNFSFSGEAGDLIAVKKGGPAAAALGL